MKKTETLLLKKCDTMLEEKMPTSAARQHILEVAADLFYREGIRAVGIDRIVEQSGVGKATLYRHFPTKDALIVAYLEQRDHLYWKQLNEVIAQYEGSPRSQLLGVVDRVIEIMKERLYRGCVFLNALTEFPEPDHPAHQRAIEHKRELRSLLSHLSQQAGASDPEVLADQLSLVINGALALIPAFGLTSPIAQLKVIATQLIDAQLADAFISTDEQF